MSNLELWGNLLHAEEMLPKDENRVAQARGPLNSEDSYRQTLLPLESECSYEDVVKILLATDRVDPDCKDKYGTTLLSWAVENGYESIVELLLATDRVDPNSNGRDGRTPLSRAVKNGHGVIVKLLLATGLGVTEETVAAIARRFDKDMMEFLLDKRGADVPITEVVVKAAAEDWRSGQDVMMVLLNR